MIARKTTLPKLRKFEQELVSVMRGKSDRYLIHQLAKW